MNLFSFNNFEKILSRLDESLQLYPERCTRNWNKESSCHKCMEICPPQVLSKKSSEINRECIKCGLCATVCPTGVFELKENSEKFLLSKIRDFLKYASVLTFACERNTKLGEKKAIKVPCLGRLDESLLVGAATLGATFIWLDDSLCSQCEIKEGHSVAQKVVQASQDVLSVFKVPAKILLSGKSPEQVEKSSFEELPPEEYSRRDLFAQFRKTALWTGTLLIENALPFDLEENRKANLSRRLPSKRVLLLDFFSQLGRPAKRKIAASNFPFSQMEIGDNCTVCGWCVKYCPTRALTHTSTNGKGGSFDFSLPLCTACGLCQDVCPEKAVTFQDNIYAPLLGMYKKRGRRKKRPLRYPLIKYHVYQCQKCDKEFSALNPSDFCLACQAPEDKG